MAMGVKALIVVALLGISTSVSADYWFARLGVGVHGQWTSNAETNWKGLNDTACLLTAGYYNSGWGIQYNHESQCFRGQPFERKPENTMDSVTGYYELRW